MPCRETDREAAHARGLTNVLPLYVERERGERGTDFVLRLRKIDLH